MGRHDCHVVRSFQTLLIKRTVMEIYFYLSFYLVYVYRSVYGFEAVINYFVTRHKILQNNKCYRHADTFN